MDNKGLYILLGGALFCSTTARLISIWDGRQPYPNRQQLARTIERCPDARSWLAQHAQGGSISNNGYDDLTEWTFTRENEQAQAFVESGQPVTCHALRDWRTRS